MKEKIRSINSSQEVIQGNWFVGIGEGEELIEVTASN